MQSVLEYLLNHDQSVHAIRRALELTKQHHPWHLPSPLNMRPCRFHHHLRKPPPIVRQGARAPRPQDMGTGCVALCFHLPRLSKKSNSFSARLLPCVCVLHLVADVVWCPSSKVAWRTSSAIHLQFGLWAPAGGHYRSLFTEHPAQSPPAVVQQLDLPHLFVLFVITRSAIEMVCLLRLCSYFCREFWIRSELDSVVTIVYDIALCH
jgi:hypothetical protein